MALKLTLACDGYDRVEALRRGEVGIERCEIEFIASERGVTFKRLFREHAFDISEMSFSIFMSLRDRTLPYRAIPVFLSRVFPHGSLYIRTDRGIRTPQDLRGRTVGVPSYHFTRGLVVRGMLADEYGVEPREIRWLVGGVDQPEDVTFVDRTAPPGVDIDYLAPDRHLGAELAAGRIDAIVSYRDPAILGGGVPDVGRLFPDFRAAERDWYRRTGLFPAMHVVGIRESLVRDHPWLPRAVCTAFEAAKARCLPRLFDLDALKVTLPWLVAEAHATVALMGADFWPYGVAKNRRMIDTQARWSFEQGLSRRLLSVSDLFEPSTLDWDSA